jgi:HSP20 family molecular chaperone IbpA
MCRILGQLDYAERVAPQPSRGSYEYFYTATSEDVLFVRADVLGFLPDELAVTIESRRLTVSGQRTIAEHRKHDNIIYLDQCPDLMFRILQLPVHVDPKRSTAVLRGGILEISLPTVLTEPNTLFRADTQWVA